MATRIEPGRLEGEGLHLDGFNVLTTIEAAFAGGVLILGRDGCLRDMASMHGNYRKVEETRPAAEAIGETLASWQVGRCLWSLDRPVSNSGRLSRILAEVAAEHDWNWETQLVMDPDEVLRNSVETVASADCGILDGCQKWCNLAREVVEQKIPSAEIVPLG